MPNEKPPARTTQAISHLKFEYDSTTRIVEQNQKKGAFGDSVKKQSCFFVETFVYIF